MIYNALPEIHGGSVKIDEYTGVKLCGVNGGMNINIA